MGCAHRQAQVAFGRKQGSCITVDNLTPRGEVLDIYYLTRASEAKQDLSGYQILDLYMALYTLTVFARDGAYPLRDAYQQAIGFYLTKEKLPFEITNLVIGTVNQIGVTALQNSVELAILTLAKALVAYKA
ncbi:MAG: hypothetical protein ABI700_00825 [Chloroflexota bacterium]